MKILIVEDDVNLRSGLQDLLMLENYQVITANDAESGFTCFQKQKPDFCILDVMLLNPNDGFTLCKRIRQTDNKISILMLSARSEEIDRVLGFECGADDYLPKPFGPRELIARIKAISRRSLIALPNNSLEKHGFFTMNDIKIDTDTQRAYRADEIIELTKRDVQILRLLHDNVGAVVSRNELFDYCWGREFMPNSRSLDQYISTLRRKLEPTPNVAPIIKTVRGVGYRFDPTIKTA